MAATKPAFNPPGKKGDIIFSALVKLAALIVLLMLGGIIVSLIISSWPSIQKFGFSFLWTKEWDAPNDIYGALVPIYGTLVTSFIALLIAVPVSFGIALFLTELAPGWLKRPLGIAIELLAAIPSIVYGMWGLFIFAPLFATYFQEPVGNILSNIPFVGALFSGPAFGIGILAAGVILAIMIIPYIAAVMRDVFEQTPVMMKESAYGIGCTTWKLSGASYCRSPKMASLAALCWDWDVRWVKRWRSLLSSATLISSTARHCICRATASLPPWPTNLLRRNRACMWRR